MDETLHEAFRDTAYLVNLDTVSWATIRIDLPLPVELLERVGTLPWAFITAWNPQARRRAQVENQAAQQELLAALQALPEVTVRPAIGVGNTGWSEPSLFVVGADANALDLLARRHGQRAYVHGQGDGSARLRWME
ncbi:DUF3293 domain-containing protein [Rhodanobacter lindaniclasticus]